jgi:LysR family transcriptional regulator, transcriptional activator of the cysJI operon
MNFTHLRAFYSVADCKSFTVAADKLHVSQSTLSLQVQSLEKKYGIVLINRHNKKFALTEEGKAIFVYAQKIFTLAYDLNNAIEDLNTGNLRIGSTPTLAHYILPGVIRVLKDWHPSLKIELYTGLSREILKKLVNFDYHVALIGRVEYPTNIICKTIARPKLFFIAAESMKEIIHLSDLSNHPIILPEQGSATRDYIIREFSKRGIPLNNCIDCENAQAIRNMVQLGMGGAFFPLYSIAEDVREGRYRKSELAEDLHLTIDIVYVRERKNMKMVKDFITAVRDHAFKA